MIKEINETTASVVLEYQLTSQNDDEETELYDVKEFYRMKYQDTRIYLLDFQRSAPIVSLFSFKRRSAICSLYFFI